MAKLPGLLQNFDAQAGEQRFDSFFNAMVKSKSNLPR